VWIELLGLDTRCLLDAGEHKTTDQSDSSTPEHKHTRSPLSPMARKERLLGQGVLRGSKPSPERHNSQAAEDKQDADHPMGGSTGDPEYHSEREKPDYREYEPDFGAG